MHGSPSDLSSRLSRLNERQKVCLRLFFKGLEAKEIARELGISPNTVNQHLRDARRLLGVSRSVQAARILAEVEGHNSLANDPRRIAAAHRADEKADAALPVSAGSVARSHRYRLSVLMRLGLIVAIAFVAVALAGALLGAAETITHIVRTDKVDISEMPNRQ